MRAAGQAALDLETIFSYFAAMIRKPPSDPGLPPRGPGRPRAFDMDEALDRAVGVFAERGYHAASICDLAAATGLAQGSLYKAFKDKRSLFLAAFDHYRAVRQQELEQAVAAGETGRERLRLGLVFYAESAEGAEGRRGCLVVNGASEVATMDPEVAEQIRLAFERKESWLAKTIAEGREDGSIPRHVDPVIAARALLCLLQGMRIVGKAAPGRVRMTEIVEAAMKTIA